VAFLDAASQQGAFVKLSSKKPEDQPTVRLAPCGSAQIRFVDAGGLPLPPPALRLELVFRPGPDVISSRQKPVEARLSVSLGRLPELVRVDLQREKGVAMWSNLIPQAPYLLEIKSGRDILAEKSFSVLPGQRLDLGDFVVPPPKKGA